ncbi:MAG TPA: DNA repair protein RecN, partial [Desulfobulbaceae bacterium]|nr:DNA repair protein RecN [Desulfobulbaceae bacterium]
MLCELRIENLALISSLRLNLETGTGGGLTVMTGETGAGKSIMLRALHMLTGERASTDWIRAGCDSCQVEALFEAAPAHDELLAQLEAQGLGDGQSIIIRRQIMANGKSRLHINGALVTARQAAELTALLLTIAGQHEHQRLLQPARHLDCLDTFGDLWPRREALGGMYRNWKEISDRLTTLRQAERDKEQRRDFLSYQLREIREAAPQPGEDENLAAEKKRLKNAQALIRLTQENLHLFDGEILERLAALRRGMEQIVQLDLEAKPIAEEIGGYTFVAEEHIQSLRHYRDSLESNPHRLEQVTERLDILQQLKRKYGENLAAVLAWAEEAAAELSRIASLDEEIAQLEKEVSARQTELLQAAATLGVQRQRAAARMEAAMERELSSLALAKAVFRVRFQEVTKDTAALKANGWDRPEFFFSANPGEAPRPLAKVASGGELSRLMLAMKCLLAQKDMVETVIFDEVDAGIGGEAAEAVARKIKELSGHHQVVCITHLPQIAARGDLHFRVEKAAKEGRTQSEVRHLNGDERVAELARMLAGRSPSEHTLAWARELLAKG